jgi:hypothetical protein
MINDKGILIIDDSDIESFSGIKVNISAEKFRLSILMAQDFYIRETLGDALWFDFLEKYVDFIDNSIPLSSEYETLYIYLKPPLVFGVLMESVFTIHNELTNKGIQNRNSDFSTNADANIVYKTQAIYEKYKDFHLKRLWSFLTKNKSDFPLFLEKCQDVNPNEPNPPFFFDMTKNKRCYIR